jgi:hypothetical protein
MDKDIVLDLIYIYIYIYIYINIKFGAIATRKI